MSYMNRYANVTDYVINKMSAAITKDMDDKLAKKLSLSGGTMDKDSEIEIPITKDDRYTKIVGGTINHYLSSTTGYSGGTAWYDQSNNLLGSIGLYGSKGIPEYYYVGNYSDPFVKVDMEGNTTIKKKLTVSGEIIGTLNGNSATATKATQDSDGNVITDTYAEKKTIVSKSATGASISIADSKEAPMILNYAPVNLFNHSFATTTTKGITFTANANGTITANGTATANITVNVGTYTFTENDIGKVFSWSDNGATLTNWDEPIIYMYYINDDNTWRVPYKFRVKKAHTVRISIYIKEGQVVENRVFRPMLEEGSTYHTYVPYTGYDIASCGKNLIGCNDKPASGTRCTLSWNGDDVTVTATASNAWSGCTIGIKGLKPNTKYTISADLEASTTNIYNGLIFGSDTVARCGYGKSGNVTLTNSTDSNGYIWILFLVDNKLNGVSGDYAIFKNIMLEEGDTASGYEASKSTSVTINSETVFPVDGLESYDGLTNVLNPYSATMKVIYATNEAGQGILKELKTKAEIDGSNAIGDWDIDITGNSATATCLINSYTYNTRPTSADDFNTFNKMGIMFSSSAMKTNKPSSDGAIVQIGWDNPSSPFNSVRQQLFLPHDTSGNMQYRAWLNSGTTGAWWAWRTLLDSNNYSKYALPLAGGTMDKEANVKIPIAIDNRYTIYTGSGVNSYIPSDNGFAMGLAYFNQEGEQLGGFGFHGNKAGPTDYYIGDYNDPLVKVDMEGITTFKNKCIFNGDIQPYYTKGIYWREGTYGDQFKIVPTFGGADDSNMLLIQSAVGEKDTLPDLTTKISIAGKSGNTTFQGSVTSLSGFTLSRSSGDTYLTIKRTDTGTSVNFGIGSSGANHGVWSDVLNKWILHADSSNVYLANNAITVNTDGNTTINKKLTVNSTSNINGITTLYLSKYDNGGRATYFLLFDITDWYLKGSAAKKGFNGFIYSSRTDGYLNEAVATIIMDVGYQKSTTPTTGNDRLALATSNGGYRPCIIHDTTNDKYFLSLRATGSGRHLLLNGVVNGTISTTQLYASDNAGTLPTGYEFLIEPANCRILTTSPRADGLNIYSTEPIKSTTDDTYAKWSALPGCSVSWYNTNDYINGQPSRYGFLLNIAGGNRDIHQLWFTQIGSMYRRAGNSDGLTGWYEMLDSNNYSNYALPKAGGTMDKGASIIVPYTINDDRYIEITGHTIKHYLCSTTGYAGGLNWYDHSENLLGSIGLFGSKCIPEYYYIGNYLDPFVKVDMEGNVSIKKALPVASGGTGKTTLADSANALINGLSTGSDAPKDSDYYVAQYAGGGTKTTTFHRRPVSALWEYIKGKISSVLGLTASSYSGNSATATKATKDGSGKIITSTYLPLAGTTALAGNIIPNKTGLKLGNATYPFSELYTSGMTISGAYIIPKTYGSGGVGSTTNPFAYSYIAYGYKFGYKDVGYNAISYASSISVHYGSGATSITSGHGITIGENSMVCKFTPKYVDFTGTKVTSSGGYTTYSDPKIKKFTDDIDIDSTKICELFDLIKVRSYKYRHDLNTVQIGINAEEFENSMINLGLDPEKYGICTIFYKHFVSRGDEPEDDKFYQKFAVISYEKLTTLAIKKIQNMEQIHLAKLSNLEERLIALEQKG